MKLYKANKKPIEISYMTYKEVVKEYKKDVYMKKINSIGHCKIKSKGNSFDGHNYFEIDTLEGEYKFTDADVLIVGIDNELYPCKIDIFEKTYIKKTKEQNER